MTWFALYLIQCKTNRLIRVKVHIDLYTMRFLTLEMTEKGGRHDIRISEFNTVSVMKCNFSCFKTLFLNYFLRYISIKHTELTNNFCRPSSWFNQKISGLNQMHYTEQSTRCNLNNILIQKYFQFQNVLISKCYRNVIFVHAPEKPFQFLLHCTCTVMVEDLENTLCGSGDWISKMEYLSRHSECCRCYFFNY